MADKKYTFDIDAACRYAASHSQPKSIGKCATYVKNAMQAGGLPYIGGYNGCDMGKYCARYGFQQINLQVNGRNPIGALKGDIMAVDHGQYGHTCIFDGYKWISDFKLNNCVPYSDGKWGNLTFWRWTDNPIYSGYDPNIQPVSGDNFSSTYGAASGINDYGTISGTGGNIFENAEENSFQLASVKVDINKNNSAEQHTRIYSTNDATIILDELSMRLDLNNSNTSTNNTSTNA